MIREEETSPPTQKPRVRPGNSGGSQAGLGRALLRTLTFMHFTLLEYLFSGRILVELGATVAFFVVFLRVDNAGIDAEKYFSLASLFLMVLTIYTTSSVLGIGDRQQGYLVLVRRVGRAGYLLGLYACALLLLTGVYVLLSIATALLSGFVNMTLSTWVLGTLPLLLNAGLLASLIVLLSPIVLPAGWRLVILGLIALAFSGSFLGNATIESMPEFWRGLLTTIQTILSWPMVPAFSGFGLALSRDYSGTAPIILVAQSSLLVALLCLAIFSFTRRELLLSGD